MFSLAKLFQLVFHLLIRVLVELIDFEIGDPGFEIERIRHAQARNLVANDVERQWTRRRPPGRP